MVAMVSAKDDRIAFVSHFEVHVQRDGRWTIDGIAETAAEALATAEEIARRPDVLAFKIVNERYCPTTGDTATRIVHAMEKPPRKKKPIGPLAARPRPMPPLDDSRAPPASFPPAPATAGTAEKRKEPSLWLLFTWASLALASASALLFMVLIVV